MQIEELTYVVNQSIEMYSKMLESSTQEIKERLIEEWTIDEEED